MLGLFGPMFTEQLLGVSDESSTRVFGVLHEYERNRLPIGAMLFAKPMFADLFALPRGRMLGSCPSLEE